MSVNIKCMHYLLDTDAIDRDELRAQLPPPEWGSHNDGGIPDHSNAVTNFGYINALSEFYEQVCLNAFVLCGLVY